MRFHKYSKIPNLYRPEAGEVFTLDEVVATEKIDGTNFSFGLIDGMPVINSRNNNIYNIKESAQGPVENHNLPMDGFGMVQAFKDKVGLEKFDELLDLDHRNILIYGEYYGKGIQDRVNYGPEKYFAFFDAYTEDWLSWEAFQALCESLKLPRAPKLYQGPPTLELLESLLEADSVQAKYNGIEETPNMHEGLVIKGLYSERNYWGDRAIAKFKPEKFSEKQKPKKSKNKMDKDPTGYNLSLAKQYVTPARLDNILEKMRCQNKPTKSVKVTGEVCKRMQTDVNEEMLEEEKKHEDFNQKVFSKHVGSLAAIEFKSKLKRDMKEKANGPNKS